MRRDKSVSKGKRNGEGFGGEQKKKNRVENGNDDDASNVVVAGTI